MYLSDDPMMLTEWRFPIGSFIAPNGYVIVWVDKDADQSGLHTNFKLSSAGESVIFGNSSNIFDKVDFTAQTTDVSYARCPDAGSFRLTVPTFGVTNNCFAGVDANVDLDVHIYPVPTTDKLTISSKVNYQFDITDLMGRAIASGELAVGETVIDLSSIYPGIYQLSIKDQLGNRRIKSVMKK